MYNLTVNNSYKHAVWDIFIIFACECWQHHKWLLLTICRFICKNCTLMHGSRAWRWVWLEERKRERSHVTNLHQEENKSVFYTLCSFIFFDLCWAIKGLIYLYTLVIFISAGSVRHVVISTVEVDGGRTLKSDLVDKLSTSKLFK